VKTPGAIFTIEWRCDECNAPLGTLHHTVTGIAGRIENIEFGVLCAACLPVVQARLSEHSGMWRSENSCISRQAV
jgi:hypothetical protein